MLKFQLEHGNKVKNIGWLKSLQQSGVTVKGLENMPAILVEAEYFWSAYVTLAVKRISNERGPQPIQMSEILAYAMYMRIDDDAMREDLFYHVSSLDAVFLQWINKKRPVPGKQQGRHHQQLRRNR